MESTINPATSMTKWSEEMEISRAAYNLWQKAGRPVEWYMEFWTQAEQEILAGRKAEAAKALATGQSLKASAPNRRGSVAQ